MGIEKALLIGVGLKPEPASEVKANLAELAELTFAAGAEVVGTTWQILEKFQSATLIGAGKVEDVKKMKEDTEAELIIVDHKLGGIQTRNLEKAWDARVLDRNQLILDIFAQRAQTYEGKLQVELAQILDQMPRMVGAWHGSLSRLGGGIGTRGPGEKAIETDRRHLRKRTDYIKKKLETVRKNRDQHRQARKKNQTPSLALIGYTNSGKSTLLNKLTSSDVLSKDQVFATLDPTTRKVYLPDGMHAVLTDTVGFIRKLPPQLIEAFKATLEESAEADVLLHVIDLSNPQRDRQIEAVNDLIQEFGWNDKPILHVFNKVDLADPEAQFQIKDFPRSFISAQTGEGLESLKKQIVEALQSLYEEAELFFPKDEEHKLYELARQTQITKKEPASAGTVCFAHMTPALLHQWSSYLTKNSEKPVKEIDD